MTCHRTFSFSSARTITRLFERSPVRTSPNSTLSVLSTRKAVPNKRIRIVSFVGKVATVRRRTISSLNDPGTVGSNETLIRISPPAITRSLRCVAMVYGPSQLSITTYSPRPTRLPMRTSLSARAPTGSGAKLRDSMIGRPGCAFARIGSVSSKARNMVVFIRICGVMRTQKGGFRYSVALWYINLHYRAETMQVSPVHSCLKTLPVPTIRTLNPAA